MTHYLLYLAAGLLTLFVPAYFIILMADARRLRRRLRDRLPKRRAAARKPAHPEDRPLLELDGPAWTAPSFCKMEVPGGVSLVSFCPPEDGPA